MTHRTPVAEGINARCSHGATLGQRLCECIALCDHVASDEEIAQAQRQLHAFDHRMDAQPELPL